MAPSCSLDEDGLALQLQRYAEAGRRARLVQRTPRVLVADLDAHVDVELVGELVAVERECCPFFELSWQPRTRRLSVSVSAAEHEPALDAIAYALSLQERAEPS